MWRAKPRPNRKSPPRGSEKSAGFAAVELRNGDTEPNEAVSWRPERAHLGGRVGVGGVRIVVARECPGRRAPKPEYRRRGLLARRWRAIRGHFLEDRRDRVR